MALDVKKIHTLSVAEAAALGRLLPQLSERLAEPVAAYLQRVAAAEQTALFAAFDGLQAVGMLTLVWYDVPSGRKAWVEDVVVDAAARGRGVGTCLVRAAVDYAKGLGAERVMLTSSPRREAARALYRKEGFEEVETTVFALTTNKE